MTVVVAPQSFKAAALRVEWRPLADIGAEAPAWGSLAKRALEPNVFYEPAFARPALPVFGHGIGAGLVWLHDKLIGFFPGRIARRHGLPPSVLTGWTHPYAPLGVPLIDREDGSVALAAWLDHMARDAAMPGLWLLPFLPEGPFARMLDATLAVRGCRSTRFARRQRALLAPDNRATYLASSVGAKKRKELRRQRRRLEDMGIVATESAADPRGVANALNDFFILESHGWKGRAGSAAARHQKLRRFVQDAVSGLAGDGKARVDRLCIDGQAIAAIVTLRSGEAAWTWKIAYDEAHARASPGVQLMYDLTEALLGDPGIVRVDSCATAHHPMIDHLWRERLTLTDRLIAVRPAPAVFALARTLESLRHAALAAAKSLRRRLRRR
jgi:hypothetical protein